MGACGVSARTLILEGRLEYALRCDSAALALEAAGKADAAAFQRSLAAVKREQARHLEHGCPFGVCTGNADAGGCALEGPGAAQGSVPIGQPLALFAAPDPLGTLDMFGDQS